MSTAILNPVYLRIAIASLGSFIVAATSLQSPLVTIGTNPGVAERITAGVSITAILVHFLITVLAYMMDPPTNVTIPKVEKVLPKVPYETLPDL